MIYLSAAVERTLERIEEVYKKSVRLGRVYYASIIYNGVEYQGKQAVKKQLECFKDFKTRLEDGTSEYLNCEEGKEDEAKLEIMYKIWDYCEPLWAEDKYLINNDVYVQRGLRSQLKKMSHKKETQREAINLLSFINTAHASSWGDEDANYKIRDFRMVETEEEFEEILNKFKNVRDLTSSKTLLVEFNSIRVAFVPVNSITIYKNKGIFEDYKEFLKKHNKDNNLEYEIKMFNLWHDVRETAIYYVYIPKEK